jgi:hypothetical protein
MMLQYHDGQRSQNMCIDDIACDKALYTLKFNNIIYTFFVFTGLERNSMLTLSTDTSLVRVGNFI